MRQLDRFFPRDGAAKVFAATTSCGRREADGGGDGAAHVTTRFNGLAQKAVLENGASGWSWFDRDSVTGSVCDVATDCAGTHYTSRFHPAGRALNVLLVLLLDHLAEVWSSGPLVAPLLRTVSPRARE